MPTKLFANPADTMGLVPAQVISVLEALSSDGVTIIATVHSPTAYAFSLFDRWGAPPPKGLHSTVND